jgi:endonuclease/exonuclease/phosphatase family metal-dependent hydrolase
MATISVKNAILSRFSDADLSRGILGSLRHEFYQLHPEAFPYTGIKALLKSLDWPQDYMQLDEYPEDKQRPWTNIIQGLTHDYRNWYINQANSPGVSVDIPWWMIFLGVPPVGKIHFHWPVETVCTLWKIPVGFDLNDDFEVDHLPHGVRMTGKPHGNEFQDYSHFGSLDYYDGKLYIPFEAADPDTHVPKILVYDAETLGFEASIDMANQADGHASWCAINPLNGFLYSSGDMDPDPEIGHLHVYQPHNHSFSYLGSFTLYDEQGSAITSRHLQGGVFSPDGQLYLVIDTRDEHAGIHGFDLLTGRRVFYKHISYNLEWDPAGGEELEGITLWNLQSGGAPHISGNLHLFRRDIDASPDNIYFKHYKEIRGRSLSFEAPTIAAPKSSADQDLSDHYGLSTEVTFQYMSEPLGTGQPGPPVTRQFTLLTYNIAQLPSLLYQGSRDKSDNLDDIGEYLNTHGYDIVCLQEAFDVGEHLMDAVSTLPHYVFGPGGSICLPIFNFELITLFILYEVNSGLLILSRFPILSSHTHEYRAKSGVFTADGHAAKGILHARIQIGAEGHQTIDVFTTHTQSGNSADERKIRCQQFIEARNFILALGIQDCWILAGDLNVIGDQQRPSITEIDVNDYPDLDSEYDGMMSVLDPLHPKDLWTAFNQINHNPGYTYDHVTNRFPPTDQARERLDFILVPHSAVMED